jgi:dephospho-CoA kinase
MILCVGLTGALGSGKGSVAETLSTLARERDLKVAYYSLSDEIRREVKRRGIQLEREALKRTANEFRSKFGNGVWARMVASKIKEEHWTPTKDTQMLIIIDAIRNIGEVEELRLQFGNRFRLLAVTAPRQVIQDNLLRRRRHDESKQALLDEGELGRLIETEMGVGEPDFGHSVAACIEAADWPALQNDGTLEDLERKVTFLAQQHIFPLFAGAGT